MELRFLVRSEIAPFCLPGTLEKWPEIIKIDDGPAIIDRPKLWNLTHEEKQYVQLQGCLAGSGFHEWIHIPLSHATEVRLYSVQTVLKSAALIDLVGR